jgi:hypothetical protein
MIVLYKGSGAGGFSITGTHLPDSETKRLIANTARVLKLRDHRDAARLIKNLPFEIVSSDNFFGDDFYILFATVPLETYEKLRKYIDTSSGKTTFRAIAETLSELGIYIRFIAIELKFEQVMVLSSD